MFVIQNVIITVITLVSRQQRYKPFNVMTFEKTPLVTFITTMQQYVPNNGIAVAVLVLVSSGKVC